MLKQYIYGTRERGNSIIEDSNGSTYSALAVKPQAGNTADTRFFGTGEERKCVVKRPKYHDTSSRSPKLFKEDVIKKIDKAFEAGYRHEQEIWNLVYPDNKADLFTEGGLRLVLPLLPGVNLRKNESGDLLTRWQQVLSTAYAVQAFHKLGLSYGDFNLDNVLIEQKPNGTFHAYLIDFGCVDRTREARSNQELSYLNGLIPGNHYPNSYRSIDDLINGLITKIRGLEGETNRITPASPSTQSRTGNGNAAQISGSAAATASTPASDAAAMSP